MLRYVCFASPVALFVLAFIWSVALNDTGATSHLLLIVATSVGLGVLLTSAHLCGGVSRPTLGTSVGGLVGGLLAGFFAPGWLVPTIAYTAALLILGVLAGAGTWLLLRDEDPGSDA